MGEQKAKQWEINKWNPAQMRLNMAQSKWQQGQSMVQGGIGDMFGSAMSFATSQAQLSQLDELFGKGAGAADIAGITKAKEYMDGSIFRSNSSVGGYNGIGIKANTSNLLPSWSPK